MRLEIDINWSRLFVSVITAVLMLVFVGVCCVILIGFVMFLEFVRVEFGVIYAIATVVGIMFTWATWLVYKDDDFE